MGRIANKFAALTAQNRAGFIAYIMAGDPDYETSLSLLKKLPDAGADFIELGVAFTDPMADGPAIEAAGLRALKAGQTLRRTLDMVRAFRARDGVTPIILMGYFNPFYAYGVDAFVEDAKAAGVDGLIVVDLPPEEDRELCLPARAAGLDFIRLATPTTDDARLPEVVKNASGFIYYVSIAGITGKKAGKRDAAAAAISRIKQASDLPAALGFGVKTPEMAAEFALSADAVVVGSALVDALFQSGAMQVSKFDQKAPLEGNIRAADNGVNAVLNLARDISAAVRVARQNSGTPGA